MIADLPLLNFSPDWSTEQVLRAAFSTGEIASISGATRRDSQRDLAARELKLTLRLFDAERRAFETWREENPPGTIVGVPVWPFGGRTLAFSAEEDDTEIHLDDVTEIDWRDALVLWDGGELFESASITAIDPETGAITIAEPLENDFPSGASVIPLMRARQLDEYAQRIITGDESSAELSFREDLASMSAVTGLATAPAFLATPLFPFQAITGSASMASGKGTHVVAGGLNREAVATLRTYLRNRIGFDIALTARAEIAALWQFFHARRGRWQRFWLAPLTRDLELAANVGANDTTLKLANFTGYATLFNAGGSRCKTLFIRSGNNWWIRRVSSLSPGEERVTLDAALGAVCAAATTHVGLLRLVRFAADDLDLKSSTPIFADVSIAFLEAEKEYGEALTASGTASGTINGALLS
jgi:hypothetical protein